MRLYGAEGHVTAQRHAATRLNDFAKGAKTPSARHKSSHKPENDL